MTDVFTLVERDSPLVISIPHDGRLLMPGQAERMTPEGLDLPDTDWHVGRLYEFAEDLDATVIAAAYSRYVVDINRPADDAELYPGQVATGLCPSRTFDGREIYLPGKGIDDTEIGDRVERYWRPYHERLRAMLDDRVARFGRVLLWDAHSIAGEVPRLFDGVLPSLNIGTNDGRSCIGKVQDAVAEAAAKSGFDYVLNGRFKGGHITRRYGDPRAGVEAVQLELAQRCYMDEATREFRENKAKILQRGLRGMLQAALDAAMRGDFRR